jgi:hypothetical protein
VSDQNPSAAEAADASVPEAPAVPQQSLGAADQLAPSETFGSAPTPDPAPVETTSPAPAPSQTPRETFGSAPTPDPAPVEITSPAPAPSQTPSPDPGDLETGSPPPKHAAPDVAVAEAPVVAKRRRRMNSILFSVVVVVVVALLAGGYWLFFLKDNPSRANVGDCLSGTENPADVGNIKLVSCTDSSATFKVTQKIANQPKTANDTACAGTDHDDVYWYGSNENSGTVLCLLKLKS